MTINKRLTKAEKNIKSLQSGGFFFSSVNPDIVQGEVVDIPPPLDPTLPRNSTVAIVDMYLYITHDAAGCTAKIDIFGAQKVSRSLSAHGFAGDNDDISTVLVPLNGADPQIFWKGSQHGTGCNGPAKYSVNLRGVWKDSAALQEAR